MSAFYKPVVGFRNDDYYFNSGVVLFDVKNWKENRCKERLLELLRDYPKPHFMNPDQDVLNILLKDQKLVLSPKYNFQTTHQVYSNSAYYDIIRRTKSTRQDASLSFFTRTVSWVSSPGTRMRSILGESFGGHTSQSPSGRILSPEKTRDRCLLWSVFCISYFPSVCSYLFSSPGRPGISTRD